MNTNCSKCGIAHIRVRVDRQTQYSRPVWVDETGRRWNGLECPDCKYLNKYKMINGRKRKRNCQVCNKPLPLNRFFNHVSCVESRTDHYYDIHADYSSHGMGDGHGVQQI